NLILHASNTALFYLLTLMLLRMSQSKSSVEEDWEVPLAAAFAALFFALHPLRVESVVWVTERRDVLSGLFTLLATLAYLRAAGNHGRKYHLACLTCLVLAVLAKEIALTLPAVFLVLDAFPLRRLGGDRGRWIGRPVWKIWLEKIPYFLVSSASA